MLAQLVSVALTASVKATDTKSVSSFNHFLAEIAIAPPAPQCPNAFVSNFVGASLNSVILSR